MTGRRGDVETRRRWTTQRPAPFLPHSASPRLRVSVSPFLPFLLLVLLLAPAGVAAQKKPKKALKDSDARRAIAATEGFALNSGAVKVKDVSVAGASPVTASAEVTLGFRFEPVDDEKGDAPSILKRKRWRAVEFRTGDRNWERIDLLARTVGADRLERARAALEELVKEFEQRQRASSKSSEVQGAESKSAESKGGENKDDGSRGEESKGGEPLTRGALTVKQLTALGSSLIAEVAVDASFRLDRDARGRWRVAEVVLGEGAGVEPGAAWQAVNAQKGERAREGMRAIREALEAFRRERGFYVEADSEVVLMDHLSPRFIARVIRLDPWGRPYRYGGTRERYVLSSDGADGRRDTADDVTLAAGG